MKRLKKNITLKFFLCLILIHFGAVALALDLRGYTQDVYQEKSEHYSEVKIFVAIPQKNTQLQEEIFNKKLSKEFKEKYREKFGNIDTDGILFTSGRFDNLDIDNRFSVNIEKKYNERKSFAEFMMKRLTEYHFDNYFKNEPNLRPAYEMKEKLSNIEVKVNQEVKLDFKYSLAGNTMEIIANNPWLDSKVILEMDPKSFGPSSVNETKLYFSKLIESKRRITQTTLLQDGVWLIEMFRPHKYNLATNLGYSNYFLPNGKTPREQKILFGLTHTY